VKKRNDLSLGEALGAMVKDLGLRPKMDELDAISAWDNVAGAMIAKHTRSIRLRHGQLRIKVDSAPLKQELSYQKDGLVKLLNERLGRVVVKEILLD
jgi:predicted nucleic acid-binding Zn ribbon protein